MKILDPVQGKALLTWDTKASGKKDVLNAVGRLAAKVRRELGDATANASQINDAETFTAASIEAAHEVRRGPRSFSAAGSTRRRFADT